MSVPPEETAPPDRESLGEDFTPRAGEASVDSPTGSGWDRRHDLDALRAAAMLLGIALHGALAYITVPYWPVRDEQTSGFFDAFVGAVHGFRMPLFFMLSGFFTAMLWRKRGLGSLVRHRALRIALPLVFFTLTILPLGRVVGEWVNGPSFGGEASEAEIVEQALRVPEDLWMAAKQNDVEALERFFEENPDQLNEPDPEAGLTPMHWASLSGSTEAAVRLVEAGAEVDARIEDGSTALGHAALMGHPEIVELLIEAGAEVNPINQYQSTPLDSAHADWWTARWVAKMLELQANEDDWRTGCAECIEILTKNGGKHRKDLTGGGGGDGDEGGSFLKQLRGAYTAMFAGLVYGSGDVFGHLWFLWFLCILLVPFLGYAALAGPIQWRGLPPVLFRQPWVFLWIVPLTMIPLVFNNEFGPDTSTGWFPMPHIVALYAVYFFFGALYFDADDREGRLVKGWGIMLPVGVIVLFPVGAGLTEAAATSDLIRVLAMFTQALYAWCLIFGLTGLFQKICSAERGWVRYVSDSAYWLYIAHIVVLFVAQALVKPLPLGAFSKFTVVCVATTAFLLLTYELFVRYTPLGTMLNGKRRRAAR